MIEGMLPALDLAAFLVGWTSAILFGVLVMAAR